MIHAIVVVIETWIYDYDYACVYVYANDHGYNYCTVTYQQFPSLSKVA